MTKIEGGSHSGRSVKKNTVLKAIFAHLLLITGLFFALYATDRIHYLPNNINVFRWDALWYYSVKSFGYQFVPGRACNMAFFPLFPYLWRLLHLPGLFICLANAIIFYASFYFLVKDRGLSFVVLLLLLSIPSCVFFNLPYSEAVFFLFGTILLRGYEQRSPQLKMLGFFGLSVTRSVSMIFIPAILLTEFFTGKTQTDNRKRWQYMAGDILACLAGFFLTAYIQWYQTGKWFYFLEVQKFWNRHWITPKFPLTTYNPTKSLGIDAIAYIFGIVAILYCLKWFLSRLNLMASEKSVGTTTEVNGAVYFSALYISATVILDTFFTFNDKAGGNIWSVNRHILCTPFAFIFIIWLYNHVKNITKEALTIAAVVILGILFTGVFRYHYMLAYYLLFFASMAVLIYFPNKRYWLLITCLISLFLQVGYFESFIQNVFIG